jgi:hypothetical protein
MARRRKAKGFKNALYMGFGGLLILAVIAAVGTLFYLKPEKIEKDLVTLCPIKEGPVGYTAIVIDRTDQFGSISKADVEIQLRDIVNGTKENEQISLYTVESVEKAPLRSLISVCNPGSPENVDPLKQSATIVQRNWKTKFLGPLDALLVKLLVEDEAPLSPIMESIQSVSITALGGNKKASLPRRIILVSDLLQNSQAWSLYTQKPNFQAFSKSRSTKGLNPDLRNVSVELLYLQRETKRGLDEKDLLGFWIKWIEAFGGRVTRVLKVSGMNR